LFKQVEQEGEMEKYEFSHKMIFPLPKEMMMMGLNM